MIRSCIINNKESLHVKSLKKFFFIFHLFLLYVSMGIHSMNGNKLSYTKNTSPNQFFEENKIHIKQNRYQ